jgi:iron complex outermembrane receptor protein
MATEIHPAAGRLICLWAAALAALAVPAARAEQPAADDADEQPKTAEMDEDEDQEILITAPRPRPADPSADAQTVGGQQLRESPRPSALEALSQEVPWVYVSSRGVGLHGIANGASGGISIRGLGGSPTTQVLVVQDGIPDCQGIFGHPLADAYVPELVERVDVISGGDSVLYGTNAMGGVIALASRWRTLPGEEFHLRASVDSFKGLAIQPALLAHWDTWDLAAAFHGRTSDGHRPGAGGDLQVGQLGARVWLTSQDRLALSLKATHLTGADPGPVTHPTPDHWFDALRMNLALTYEHFSERMTWRATAFASGGRHELYDGFDSLDGIAGLGLENRWQVQPRLELRTGLACDFADGTVKNRIEASHEAVASQIQFALYQQVTWRPLDALHLVAGARQVESLDYGFLFLYKFGASVSAWPGGRLRARWATNFRHPTLRELYLPYPVANPDLQPESSKSLDFGLDQEVGDRLHVELTGFRTEATNLIKTFGSWPSALVINIDHVVFWGVEGLVRLRAGKRFELMFGGTYLDVGRYTKQNPDLKLDARLRFAYRGLSASFSAEWVHGLYQNNYGRDPLADVFWLDLDARYLFEQASMVVFLIARNLTDRRYAFIDRYPMPGFHLVAGLEVHL